MRNIFAVDITKDRQNTITDGDALMTDRISEDEKSKLTNSIIKYDNAVNSTQLPLWLRGIKGIAGFFVLMVIFAVVKAIAESNISLEQAYSNAPLVFIIGAGCLVAFGAIEIAGRIKKRTAEKSKDFKAAAKELEDVSEFIRTRFSVPANARLIDVLSFRYKMKKGRAVPVTLPPSQYKYNNIEKYVYVRDGKMFFTDESGEISFPIENLAGIKQVNKRIILPNWNKDDLPSSDKYKKYKINIVNQGISAQVSVKPYYSLMINHQSGQYEIFIPVYETGPIQKLTGITTK